MSRTLRVLIVEDNPDDVELVLRELRRGGLEPSHERVETPEAMGEALDRGDWDVVISDWSMPRFSAPEAIRLLRGRNSDLPCIIVSGTIGEDVAVEAMRTGANDFLVKDRLARLVPAVDRELREAAVRRERNKMQEQLMISDRMASVGILAAGVAHEINNPLASVVANLDLARKEVADLGAGAADPDRLRELAEELADAAESACRIRDIVRDIKLFSRSDDEVRGAVDVHRAIDSSLRMAWNEIKHRARLARDFSAVPLVHANESRLGQVFLNLVINAAHAIPEGRADANEIRVTTRTGRDGFCEVEVRDTGSGMTPEVLKRLFTPFFTTKPVGVGTGLGLSICRRIVSSLGGEVLVESASGKGTAFCVRIPPARGAATPARARPTLETAAARRGRVLVVDDEPLILSALRRTLGRDHEVIEAQRAADALSRIAGGERFDAIVCDLMMPEFTGMDLHGELARVAPDQAERMIFLTGGAFTANARAFLDGVPNPVIEKPFQASALRGLVNERVGEK